jgi:selenide, water dikinase
MAPARLKSPNLKPMRSAHPTMTDLVLLGGGHAHVEVLRRFALRPLPGLRLTLVAREPLSPYTGMLPAVVRGEIPAAIAEIDLAALAAAAGARLIVAEAEGLELAACRILLAARPLLSFDLLSIDVGGVPAGRPAAATAVKPIGRFLAVLAALEATLLPGARIAVVGGGAGGVELALALARRLGGRAAITLISATVEILPEAPPRARQIAHAALKAAGVMLVLRRLAEDFRDGKIRLAGGAAISADIAFWATGIAGPPFLAASGLACDPDGFIRVAPTFESLSHPRIFAAGDCAAIAGFPRPKAGVWAVRAGPPLAENLRRAALGRPLRAWRPQRAALAILGLGEGRALAWRGRIFVLSGRAVARWKEWLDRRWIAKYRQCNPINMASGGSGHPADLSAGTPARSDPPKP